MNDPDDILKILDSVAEKNLKKWKLSETKGLLASLRLMSQQQAALIKQQHELADQQAQVLSTLNELVREVRREP